MSLVREKHLYKAYCDLCFYTGQKPLSKEKWIKQNNTHSKQNRTNKNQKDVISNH